jgi:molybdopterin/thiamine biosynthesis adenylyltransferase
VAPWFERLPGRLDRELQALRNAGFTPEIDQTERNRVRLILGITCQVKGANHLLRVEFPRAYPYFAFQVFAPSLSLARHQDPYSKALCFIARIESEWRIDDTVAKYLLEQLPDILKANESGGPFDGEIHEGAPVTPYFAFQHEDVVLIGDWAVAQDAHQGTLLLGAERGSDPRVSLRAAVLQIKDAQGNVFGELDPRVASQFDSHLAGRWVRLPVRPKLADPTSILADAIAAWPALATPRFQRGPDVIGLIFPDEVRYRDWQDTCIFLVRRKVRWVRTSKHKRLPRGDQYVTYLVRADRAGRTDLQARVPRLAPMANKKAAVFGLGALGSMTAWQLARAGIGRLALVDNDFVNAATTPRWVLGLSAAGRNKVTVLADHIRRDYPLVDVDPIYLRVGATAFDGVADERMAQALEGADVIIDCAVERTVHHYLSSIACQQRIPYIWASGTPGAWGGFVGRIWPDTSRGCWKCFCAHLIDGAIPEPPHEQDPEIQPVGCDAPTFRGAGFDLDTVAIMCARLAASTMCRGVNDAYGDFNWDVATVDLWKDGHPIAPEWKTFELVRHNECDAHD